MYEKYIIKDDSLRPANLNGVSGFEIDLRLAYYRGLLLSMVEDIEVSVNGTQIDRGALSLKVSGENFLLDQLITEYDARWEFHEAAVLFVPWQGTLTELEISITEVLRISYQPAIVRRSNTKTLSHA